MVNYLRSTSLRTGAPRSQLLRVPLDSPDLVGERGGHAFGAVAGTTVEHTVGEGFLAPGVRAIRLQHQMLREQKPVAVIPERVLHAFGSVADSPDRRPEALQSASIDRLDCVAEPAHGLAHVVQGRQRVVGCDRAGAPDGFRTLERAARLRGNGIREHRGGRLTRVLPDGRRIDKILQEIQQAVILLAREEGVHTLECAHIVLPGIVNESAVDIIVDEFGGKRLQLRLGPVGANLDVPRLTEHCTEAVQTIAKSVARITIENSAVGGEHAPQAPHHLPHRMHAVRFSTPHPRVRRGEADSVHSMRKVVRRLRSVLASYRGIFDRDASDALRDRLHRFGAVLGEARDVEVRADRAQTELESLPAELVNDDVHRRLVDNAREDYVRALERVHAFLSSEQYYRLLDFLEDFVDSPPVGKHAGEPAAAVFADAIAAEARRTLKRAKAVRRAGAVASDDALPALHDVRKAVRRLRYTIESIDGRALKSLGSPVGRIGDAAERVQDALGDHRDGLLFSQHLVLEANRAHAGGEKTFAYGVLYGRARDSAEGVTPAFTDEIGRIKRNTKKL